jgi:hypothetical protein
MKLIDKSRKSHVVASSPNDAKDTDETKHLSVEQVPGEDHDLTLARVRLHPVVRAATTMLIFDKALNDHKFTSLAQELGQHEKDVKAGSMGRAESILINQANTLDVIFNTLAQRAGSNVGSYTDVAEKYLRMALKAQSQCRTTLETLAEIKSPRSATFIKQANIAEQQQVNNGPTVNGASPLHAHETKTENQSNELLEVHHGERMDSGAAGAAIGTDPQLETVGKIDRTANRGRKNAQ